MDEAHRDLLQTNFIVLSELISESVKLLTKDLWVRKLLSKPMADSVLEKNDTNLERAMALLELVPRRGSQAFETLYTSCLSLQLWDVADILHSEKAPHGPAILPAGEPRVQRGATSTSGAVLAGAESSDEEAIPDVWPPSQAPNLVGMKVVEAAHLDAQKTRKYKQKYKNAHTTAGLGLNYSMKRGKPNRGLVFVINNYQFTTLNNRDGTGKDLLGIDILFRKLGFKVVTKDDLTSDAMWEECVKVSKMDFKNYDCFVLFIMTHGHKGVVFGTDGMEDKMENEKGEVINKLRNYLEIPKITDLFCHVDSLRGKPKLFFFQACQGSERDSGKPVVLEEHPDSGLSPDLNYLGQEAPDSGGEKLPSRADVFVAMATTEDSVSWRRPDFGSWFIQAVIEVFARYAYKMELQHLMRRVNGLLAKAETVKGRFKQVMVKRDTFQKQFHFFPGLYDPDNMEL